MLRKQQPWEGGQWVPEEPRARQEVRGGVSAFDRVGWMDKGRMDGQG